jgi:hypothetical protein
MTMSSKMIILLSAAALLGTASAALATNRVTTTPVQGQSLISTKGNDSVAPELLHDLLMSAQYFAPSPAPLKAYTYTASVRLGPSTSKRVLQGEFRFPIFSATPSISVQIISSIGAVPMQVKSLKIVEITGASGALETQIIVEAETIVDAPAGGFYFANIVVTGIPVTPPKVSNAAQMVH